jgi:menaquinone-specific isochorismate synthase
VNTAQILSIFQEKLLLNFKEQFSHRIEIKNATPPKQSVRITKYEADYNKESEERIHELLKLCKCKNSPFFKWITPHKSFHGFGNFLSDEPSLTGTNTQRNTNLGDNLLFKELSKHKELPFFHALPFPSEQSEKYLSGPIWKRWDFPSFMVPEVSLEKKENKLTLTLIQNAQSDESSINAFEFLDANEEFNGLFKNTNDTRVTDKVKGKGKEGSWHKQISQILTEVNGSHSSTSKVVLARTKELSATRTFDSIQLFDHLSRLHRSNLLTHFYLGIKNEAFFGFSPENLLKREGKEIFIDAIAGTRPRSDDEGLDLELEEELKNSQKEQAEHANVIDAIKKSCLPLGEIQQHQQVVLKLSKVQHLKTPISLKLNKIDKTSIYQLAKILHPTPAVGGTPRRESLNMISQLESFTRGLYAGAIGLQTEDSDQFIVAIRSLKTSIDQATLFAGAGIVNGSDASDEWNETEAKFNSFFPPELLIQ